MSKKLSNDYQLWVDSSTPGTPALIKGQTDMTINRQAQQIDTSSKNDFPYGTSAPGLRTLSINCECIPDLPDANGYTRLETIAADASPTPVMFQVRKGGVSGADPADVVFECEMYVGDFNTPLPQNGVVKVQFTLTAAAAPTVDLLA